MHFEHQASPTTKKYLLETMGSGVALFDYDNDGRLDIFFSNGGLITDPMPKGSFPVKTGRQYWNRLFRQKPDGTFEDVTERAGLKGSGYCTGVAVGDYDNDGRLDLIVCRYMVWDFDDIYCGAHLPGHRAYCHPDLFQPISLLLYHNDGNGKFTEVAQKAGLTRKCKGLGVAIADFDQDGHTDIFIANDSMEQALFHNKGNGTFEEVGMISGCAVDGDGNTFAGMGVDFADYNNDGHPDLIVTDLANQTYALYTSTGDGNFRYDTYASGLSAMTLLHSGWGVRFMDYDNDGWKDLFIAQGHVLDTVRVDYPNLHYREPPLLVRNAGKGGKFLDVSAHCGEVFQQRWSGRAMAVGDLNNDGRLDVIITTNNGPAYILMNQTETPHHWISIQLEGVRSNRDGIGARIEVTTSAGRQTATVTTSGSYQASSDRRAHFGLAGEPVVSRIEIRWPSGIVQTLHDVKADQFLTVKEKV